MTVSELWQSLDPRARAAALFAGLGLAYNLLQSLVMPAEWEYWASETVQDPGQLWPLLQPAGVLLRVVITLATGALLLWGLQPGRRRAERLGMGLGLGAYCLLVSLAYPPVSLLMVLPPVLRYWWPVRPALLVTLLLTLGLTGVWYVLTASLEPGLPLDLKGLVTLLVLMLSQGGFAFAAFELTLRRDQQRAELHRALGELQRYHGLDLQHAALEERTRISRELHDTLGHELTALRLELQRAKRLVDRPQELRESIARALSRSDESMQSLQAAVRALRPQVADGGTLYGTAEQLIRAWPVPVQLQCQGPEPSDLRPQVRVAAFRTLQEGLTNALKHAPGQEVTVTLHPTDQSLLVRVTNPLAKGAGPLDLCPAGEMGQQGLAGLRERLAEVGASLELHCTPERFELCAEFPLGAARLETK